VEEVWEDGGLEAAAYPISQRRQEAEGHSAPRYMNSLLTKTWWGQLMLMLCTS
jgi:hypothetical protein